MDKRKVIINHHKMQMMLRQQIIDSMKEELKVFESLAAKNPAEYVACFGLTQLIYNEEKIYKSMVDILKQLEAKEW